MVIPTRKVYVVPHPNHDGALRIHLRLFHRMNVDGPYDTLDFIIEAHEYAHWNKNSEYFSTHQHSKPPVIEVEEWEW